MKKVAIIDLSGILHGVINGAPYLFDKSDYTLIDGKKSFVPYRLKQAIIGSIINNKNRKAKAFETVIALDMAPYWRKTFAPHYKGKRSDHRKESDWNWKDIFNTFNELIAELKTYFPWKVVGVQGAEADDVMAILSKLLSANYLVELVSSDTDLVQLQEYKNIQQYSMVTKKMVTPKQSPYLDLQDKIIRGDPGDGIPNIKSPDDQFMNPLRKQPSITKKFIDSAIMAKFDPTVFCLNESEQINYARNKLLVDFNSIPDEMQELIVQEYRNAVPADIFNTMFYISKNEMHALRAKVEVI